MTEEERNELKETAKAWKANSKLYSDMLKDCDEKLKFGYQSIATTFDVNARILENSII